MLDIIKLFLNEFLAMTPSMLIVLAGLAGITGTTTLAWLAGLLLATPNKLTRSEMLQQARYSKMVVARAPKYDTELSNEIFNRVAADYRKAQSSK